MEFARRDLGSADLWADSLERSLARRGRPRRASLELGRLTAARDLADAGTVDESIAYWRARRAATASSTWGAPAVGGASVLALLAATTLPALAGGGASTLRKGSLHRSGALGAGGAPALYVIHRDRWVSPALTLGPAHAGWTGPAARHPAARPAAAPARPARGAATPATRARRVAGRFTLTATSRSAVAHVLSLSAPSTPAVSTVAAALPTSHTLALDATDTHVLTTAAPAPAAPAAPAATTTVAAAPAAKPVVYGKIAFGDIRDAQRMLGIPIDGILGPDTGSAIRAFQAAHALTVDGVVGPATWNALAAAEHAGERAAHRAAAVQAHVVGVREASTLQLVAAPQSTSAIIALQQALGIPADGNFGSATLAAVQAFQTAHGLDADGVVGPATQAALGLPAGPTLQSTDLLTGGTTDTTAAPAATTTAPATATTDTSAATATTATSAGVSAASTTSDATTSTFGPPAQVQLALNEMIAAGDQIATLPYLWGGGHGSWVSPGYDCSGSVSYVLHAAGLLSVPEDSSGLMSYGAPGPGQYVTIYANAGHAWMTIDGRRFDTVALQETGSRWGDGGGEFDGFVVRHPVGF